MKLLKHILVTKLQFVLAINVFLMYNVWWKRRVYTMSNTKAIILAAGAGTRMKSDKPKVIHKIMDKTMLDYVVESAMEAGATDICVVVGHGKEEVISSISYPVTIVTQDEQLGTGHAVMQAADFIGSEGEVFVLFGDTPLITGASLSKLREYHNMNNHGVTVLSTNVSNSDGYGRIIRDEDGNFIRSVEHKDASILERKKKEINSGMYIYEADLLSKSLAKLTNHNVQGEYYLPDTLVSIMNDGHLVESMKISDYEEILGVNSKAQLFEATTIMRRRINYLLMESGVTMIDANQVYIGKDVEIDNDVTILPGTIIEGKSKIGIGSVIGPNAKIINSCIGDNSVIDQSTVLNSNIGNYTSVGPFAYVRPNCEIGNHIKVGDFVEIKNSTIKDHTKISHLTYIGDADVGEHVNFGCGTVVVNYDGVNKYRSTIGDHAFIGCNTNLVSPVIVEKNAYTAAGSTITNDVPENALAVARARQVNKLEWVKKKQR